MESKRIFWLATLIMTMVFSACSKEDTSEMDIEEEEDVISIDSDLQYSFVIGNTQDSGVADNEVLWSSSGFSGTGFTDGDTFTWTSTMDKALEDFSIGFSIGEYVLSEPPGGAVFATLFSPGPRDYAAMGEIGFELSLTTSLGSYRTRLGDQTESLLEIVESQQEIIQNSTYVKVYMTFSCTLYNEEDPTQTLTLTNGQFVNYFAY